MLLIFYNLKDKISKVIIGFFLYWIFIICVYKIGIYYLVQKRDVENYLICVFTIYLIGNFEYLFVFLMNGSDSCVVFKDGDRVVC